jgi:hypothetical protein
MNDTQHMIGKLLPSGSLRDAIHIAVAPVVAGVSMHPGQAACLRDGEAWPVERGEGIGIVDPYLPEAVPTGGRCFLFLYPNTITDLKHTWTHPSFATERTNVLVDVSKEGDPVYAMAKQTLEKIAKDCELTYERLMKAGAANLARGTTLNTEGRDYGDEMGGKEKEFWAAYEIVAGAKVTYKDESIFSCCS